MSDDLARLLGQAGDRFGDLDDRLIQAIRAELQAVERIAGGAIAVETFIQTAGPLPQILHLVRPIAEPPVTSPPSTSITGIIERRSLAADAVLLDPAGDYRVIDRWRIARTPDGPNPACTWGREVVCTYTAALDLDLRDRITLDLVALDLEFSTRRSETLPDYAYNAGDQAALRRALLDQLGEGARATIL